MCSRLRWVTSKAGDQYLFRAIVSTQHGVLGTGAGCRRMCRYSQFAGAGLISGSMKESEVGIGAGYCVVTVPNSA